MSGFRRQMADDAMIKGFIVYFMQNRSGRRSRVTIEYHGNTPDARGYHRTNYCRQFMAAKTPHNLKGVVEVPMVTIKSSNDSINFTG